MTQISLIVGRNLESVEKILGYAEKKEFITDSRAPGSLKAYFQNENITVVFIGNVADWIMVNNVGNKTIENFIETLGLTQIKPSFYNKDIVARYYNIGGLKEIAFFNDGKNNISFVYIKAFTE